MSLGQETKDLFEQVDDAILDLRVLQAETKETIDLVNNLLLKINENIKIIYDKGIKEGEGEGVEDTEIEKIIITDRVNDLNDLLILANKYGSAVERDDINVNTKILFDLIGPLEKLNKIIGMNDIKNLIVDLILTSMQDLYDPKTLFHSIIVGPPGVGKTLLAKILGEIYLKLGILKNTEYIFKMAKRSDLVGKYLGHTAIKTQDLIDNCTGGVLFIDEVYSLGNEDKKDSFSKECIDTINLNLTEKENFICIIAGYPDEIENCFFAINPGLKRRFPFKYEIVGYQYDELANIFLSKMSENQWIIDINKDELINFFKKNKEEFKYFGGDIDTLILNCKMCHSRRIFGQTDNLRKIITMTDIYCGFSKLLKIRSDNKIKDKGFSNMYI